MVYLACGMAEIWAVATAIHHARTQPSSELGAGINLVPDCFWQCCPTGNPPHVHERAIMW